MNSLIVKTAAQILVGLMLVYSAYLLLRGHNQPGGGFIGALVAVIAFALYAIVTAPRIVRKIIYIDPVMISVTGLLCTVMAGLVGMVQSASFLTAYWWAGFLNTSFIFDLGVYLTVFGSVLTVILHLEHR